MKNLIFLITLIFGLAVNAANLLPNGGFEAAAAKWRAYCDAAGTAPVDGIGGGVAGFAISSSTTSPLDGKSSGLITKDAANRQGCGISTDFTAKPNKVYQVKLNYKVTSGTYTEDAYKVYIYDIVNNELKEVSPVFVKNSLLEETYSGVVQTGLGTSYRLIVHNASTNAVAVTMKIDEGSVDDQLKTQGSFSTDFRTYTGTCSGSFTTNTTYSCKEKIIGDEVEFQINLSFSGAPNATNLTLNIPYSIDTTKLVSTTPDNLIFGKGSILDAGIKGYPINIDYINTTSVRVIIPGTDQTHIYNNGFVTNVVPFSIGAGDSLSVTFKVPIVGKSSNTVLSSEYLQRDFIAHIGNSTSQSISTGSDVRVQYSVAIVDSHGATTLGSNARITAQTTGCYDVYSLTTFTYTSWAINDGFTVRIKKNGSTNVLATGIGIENTNNFSKAATLSGVVCLNANDYIETYINLSRSGGATTLNGDNLQNYLILKLRSSGTQVASEVNCSVKAYHTSGASLATAGSTIIFDSESYDYCGEYDPGTGVFTASRPGEYEIHYHVYSVNFSDATFETQLMKNVSTGLDRDDIGLKHPTLNRARSIMTIKVRLLTGENLRLKNTGAHIGQNLYTGDNYITIRRVGNY